VVLEISVVLLVSRMSKIESSRVGSVTSWESEDIWQKSSNGTSFVIGEVKSDQRIFGALKSPHIIEFGVRIVSSLVISCSEWILEILGGR
jgi:hypothetical protein